MPGQGLPALRVRTSTTRPFTPGITGEATIERLTLARVTAVPDWHPEHATFEPFPVHAWVVRHRDGVINEKAPEHDYIRSWSEFIALNT